MSTIIMLPPATPQPSRPAGPGVPSGAGGGGREFASTLHAVVDRAGATDGAADGTAGPGSTPPGATISTTESGTPTQGAAGDGAGGAAGGTGTESPITVAQIVQSAADLLAAVAGLAGTAAAGTAADDGATTGTVGTAASADDPTGALAQVIDLDARRAAHAAPDGIVVTQPGASGQAIAADGAGSAGATAEAAGTVGTPTAPATPVATSGPTAPLAAGVEAVTGGLAAPAQPATAQEADTAGTVPQPQPPAVTATGQTGASTGVVPTQATAPIDGTTAIPALSPAPSEPARPLAEQLGVRLAALRGAGAGEHVLTLRVDPESIGPVRVVAHIGAEGVRIELLGATDQAREALKAALPDLRRDLVAAGLPADLGLGNGRGSSLHGQGTGLGGQGSEADGRGPGRDANGTAHPGVDGQPADRAATHSPTSDRLVGIDLLA